MKKVILLCICLTGCLDTTKTVSEAPVKMPAPAEQITEVATVEQEKRPVEPSVIPEAQLVQLTLKSGQTLAQLLKPYQVNGYGLHRLSKKLSPFLAPNKMKIGQVFDLKIVDNVVEQMVINVGFAKQLRLSRVPDDWQLAVEQLPTTLKQHTASSPIKGSLYFSSEEQGVPADVINRFIVAFSHYVDFQRGIKAGDSFKVAYTRRHLASDHNTNVFEKLDYAQLTLSGEVITLYYFTDGKNNGAFYDEQGQLAQSFLLKTPVDGARLTSYFGRRKHPILGYNRLHKGLDFDAQEGAEIMAAGDGVIDFAARKSTFGNLVRINHDNGYQTLYAHLKGFAKGIKKGKRVKQSQLIGYVGTTGRSQGNHLHYEVHRNGKPINPLKLKQFASKRLEGETLARFNAHQQQLRRLFYSPQPSQQDNGVLFGE